jgi:hypothetical protein
MTPLAAFGVIVKDPAPLRSAALFDRIDPESQYAIADCAKDSGPMELEAKRTTCRARISTVELLFEVRIAELIDENLPLYWANRQQMNNSCARSDSPRQVVHVLAKPTLRFGLPRRAQRGQKRNSKTKSESTHHTVPFYRRDRVE